MDFSRRLFLGGAVALASAGFVKTATEVPTLWGDMIHDDSPALNALFRGEPIRVLQGKVIQGSRPAVVGAHLLLGSPLLIKGVADALISNCSLTAARGFDGDHIIKLQDTVRGTYQFLSLDTRNMAIAAPPSATRFVF